MAWLIASNCSDYFLSLKLFTDLLISLILNKFSISALFFIYSSIAEVFSIMKIFTPEQVKTANNFFDNYLYGNVDVDTISPREIQENIALPSLFKVAFTTFNGNTK